MGKLEGKVAFITGAARGQGRSHAVRLASEGARVIGIDLCEQISSVEYPMATDSDLAETERLVRDAGSEILTIKADVRDRAALEQAVKSGVGEFGRLDIVLANAGIMPITGELAFTPESFTDSVDVLLTGVFNTLDATVPILLEQNQGGSIVITGSTAALKGQTAELSTLSRGFIGYTAAKHGAVGVMRCYARALGASNIRVNMVHPCGVQSPMVVNEAFGRWFEEHESVAGEMSNVLPVGTIEPADVSAAILWLCSDEARYVTGINLPVDAGYTIK